MRVTKVDDEVWIGADSKILNGSSIGIGAVIGAGSVVSKNIPPFVVAVGNPCRVVKRIFSNKDLNYHLKCLGYSSDRINEIIEQRESALGKQVIPVVGGDMQNRQMA